MAEVTGLEPAASGVTGRRSNQLSYSRSQKRAPRGTRWPRSDDLRGLPREVKFDRPLAHCWPAISAGDCGCRRQGAGANPAPET